MYCRVLRFGLVCAAASFASMAPAQETNRSKAAPNFRAAAPYERPQILFLRLKAKDGAVTLVESQTRAGLLKARGTPVEPRPGFLHVVAESEDGQALWMTAVDDPLVRRVEGPDHSADTGIASKQAVAGEAEFSVRVPLLKMARQVSIYRIEAKAVPSEVGKAKANSAERRLVGRVPIAGK